MLIVFLTLQMIIGVGMASAFNSVDLDTLRRTNKCVGCDLKSANLRGAYLKGANLENAKLKYVKFQKAYLFNVNFNGANLKGANLEGALWTDGVTICKKGSIGKCLAELPEKE